MALTLTSRRVGEITVIACGGRLVEGAESQALQERVYALLPHEPFIILDLGAVDFIDSSGLGLLVRLLNRARAAQGDLKLCAATARAREVLRLTRLQALLVAYASEADAIAAFYERAVSEDAWGPVNTEILCVDPSADVLAYVREVLKQAGYGVTTSDNLPDALLLLKSMRPKALVVGGGLRSAKSTETAETFNRLADAYLVIELGEGFSTDDAGAASRQLLDDVRAALGDREPLARA